MLVLCRHIGEKIMIGHHIVVTVTEIAGDKVRLGIEAPRSIAVNRQEVAQRIATGRDERLDRRRRTTRGEPPA